MSTAIVFIMVNAFTNANSLIESSELGFLTIPKFKDILS